MQTRPSVLICAVLFASVTTGCDDAPDTPHTTLKVADESSRPGEWVTYGRDSSEQRFSPLTQIDEKTVGRLGLAWSFDLGTLRALEATPLVSDGVLYTTSAWSLVYALNAT